MSWWLIPSACLTVALLITAAVYAHEAWTGHRADKAARADWWARQLDAWAAPPAQRPTPHPRHARQETT